jgi:hypothetical protein
MTCFDVWMSERVGLFGSLYTLQTGEGKIDYQTSSNSGISKVPTLTRPAIQGSLMVVRMWIALTLLIGDSGS